MTSITDTVWDGVPNGGKFVPQSGSKCAKCGSFVLVRDYGYACLCTESEDLDIEEWFNMNEKEES